VTEEADSGRLFVARFRSLDWEMARRLVAVMTVFNGRYMMSGRDGVCVARGEKKSTSSTVSSLRDLPLCADILHSEECSQEFS
jgi:hypothetical protein